jgi:DNA-binding transcriptional MerR regulator
MEIDGFPTEVAAKLGGVTPKTLETWRTIGFLAPSTPAPRRGMSATYTFRDLVAIRVASELREAGIGVPGLKRVVKYLRSRKGLSATEVLAGTALVTDGRDVFEVEGAMTISALQRPGQRMLLVVPLDRFVADLQAKARALRAA